MSMHNKYFIGVLPYIGIVGTVVGLLTAYQKETLALYNSAHSHLSILTPVFLILSTYLVGVLSRVFYHFSSLDSGLIMKILLHAVGISEVLSMLGLVGTIMGISMGLPIKVALFTTLFGTAALVVTTLLFEYGKYRLEIPKQWHMSNN